MVVYGLAVVLVMVFRPQGLLGGIEFSPYGIFRKITGKGKETAGLTYAQIAAASKELADQVQAKRDKYNEEHGLVAGVKVDEPILEGGEA